MRFASVIVASLFLMVGCTTSAEEEGEDFTNRVPVTFRILNEQGDPLPGTVVTITAVQNTKNKEKPVSISRLTDPKGQVFEDLEKGEKYLIEVLSTQEEITVPKQSTMIRITAK